MSEAQPKLTRLPRAPKRGALARLLLLTLLACGQGEAAAPQDTPRRRAFACFAPLGGPDASVLSGIEQLRDRVTIVRAILNGRVESSSGVSEFWDEIMEKLELLDLASLHEELPILDAEGWRSLSLDGRWDGTKYLVTSVGAEEARSRRTPVAGANFPDLQLSLAIRPSADAESYSSRFESTIGLGEIKLDQLLSFGTNLLALLEAESNPREGVARPAKRERERAKSRHPKLSPADRELYACGLAAFPKMLDALDPIMGLNRLTARSQATGPSSDERFDLKIDSFLKRGTLEDSYPELGSYLEDLEGLLDLDFTLEDAQGRRLFHLRFEGAKRRMAVEATLRDGCVVPVDPVRGPCFEDRIDARELRRLTFRLRGRATVRLNGVSIKLDKIAIQGSYQRRGNNGLLLTRFRELPEIEVLGRAYGIVPTWLIDLLIPSNMDDLTRAFLHKLTKGNGGRGFQLRGLISSDPSGLGALRIKQQSEWLDNFIIRLGFRLASDKLLPSEDALADLGRLASGVLEAISGDLAAGARDFHGE
jgi:hypothetical protein